MKAVAKEMELRNALPMARSVVMMVLVRSSITVELPVRTGVIRVSVAMSFLGLGPTLKEDTMEKGVGGLLEGSLGWGVRGLAVRMLSGAGTVGVLGLSTSVGPTSLRLGAVGFAIVRVLSSSVIGGKVFLMELAVLVWFGARSLMFAGPLTSVLLTCMGAGVRSWSVGLTPFA